MWIYFSLGAVLCWATANIVDKFLLRKWLHEPLLAIVIPVFLEIPLIFIIILFFGVLKMPLIFVFFNIIAGVLYILPIMFYLEALKKEEVTRVAPLFQVAPLFVLLFAAIVLKEDITLMKYIGIFLLFSGVFVLSYKDYRHFKFNKSFLFMLLAAACLAANTILTKYLLSITNFQTVFLYTRIGIAMVSLPLFILFWKKIQYIKHEHGLRRLAVISGNYLFDVAGVLFVTIALTYSSMIMVNIIIMTEPFFLLLFSIVLCLFKPKILKEKLNYHNITQKAAAIILMFCGVVLIL